MQSNNNHLPPFHTPFFTITITPIDILSNTQLPRQQPDNTSIYAFFAAAFFIDPNSNSLALQGQPPASEAAMKAQRILTNDQIPIGATCCVCIEDLSQTSTDGNEILVDTIRCMPCDHIYHETCLFTWLKQSATCPTCRYEIESDNAEWNAASRRRAADRSERTRVLREEQERRRRATRKEKEQSVCGLVSVGCCEFDDDEEDLSHPPDSAFDDGERITVTLCCNHSFHRNCLITNLRVLGQDVFTVDGELRADACPPVEVRCPCCRKITSIAAENKLAGMLFSAGPIQDATADDRPRTADARQQASTESIPKSEAASNGMLRETRLPEKLETD